MYLDAVYDWFIAHGIRILAVILISIALYFLLRRFVPFLVKRVVEQRMKGQPDEETKKRVNTLSSVFINTGIVVIVIIAIITILPEFGVNIAAMLTGLGIVGIAIGFGAQTLIRDLIAGMFILLEDHYRVGDVVNVAGIGGLVEEIGLRRTILRDLDGVVHSIPNGEIKIASNVTKGYSRVNLNISVAYGEDLDHVIEVINRVCDEMAKEPKWKADFVTTPKVLRVDNLGDSGIDIKILGDTKPSRQWDIMGELRLRLKKSFDKEGIEIPWPHTKVYFGNNLPMVVLESQAKSDKPANEKAEPS